MIRKGLRQIRFMFGNIPKNPYKVLGLNQNATEEEIKTAYYKLAKQYHPDIRPQNAEQFKQINQAYNTLKDPQKKSMFDNPSNYNDQHNNQYSEQTQYRNQNRSNEYSNAQRNAYYYEMFNRMNRQYQQDYRRDPFSMKRQQMRQMRRQYYRNLFWQQHFYGYNGPRYASPFQIFFMSGVLFTFLLILGSLYFSLYQYDQMRRKSYSYEYVPYPYQEEDDQFY